MATQTFRFVLIFIVVGVQVGLAVLGMGGLAFFFSHPPLEALAIVGCVLLVASMFSEGNLNPGEREDRANRWVLVAFGSILLLISYLPPYTDRMEFWTIDGEITRWIGVTLFAIGGALRLWPVFVLGRRFSGLVAIQPNHKLVTSGIYSVVRNPSYLGLLITTLGWVLAFRSSVGVLITACLIPPLLARIHAEEAMLRSQFGSEFDSYCAHTSRLIPGLY
ncbi:MAG TPA: isoprenylcysteine carboxylmethyltransferase family protein [Candidatus Binatus sp.]|uniref:methyltransferase family protein n=1 Tax=Candidatus Binatus sp. TaxID=2811406 RepID=UPI002B488477|nr:isoprenylcysteine carboxylmethyltransferase family protein [Candidatus Binatus sp.]HKN14288.1 isoprenylcysteine carboxylmethyltransferase family protein [Candidatus Binatus sp.]